MNFQAKNWSKKGMQNGRLSTKKYTFATQAAFSLVGVSETSSSRLVKTGEYANILVYGSALWQPVSFPLQFSLEELS